METEKRNPRNPDFEHYQPRTAAVNAAASGRRILPPTDGTSFSQPHPQYSENQQPAQKAGLFSFLRSKKKEYKRKIARQMIGRGTSSHDAELKSAAAWPTRQKGR